MWSTEKQGIEVQGRQLRLDFAPYNKAKKHGQIIQAQGFGDKSQPYKRKRARAARVCSRARSLEHVLVVCSHRIFGINEINIVCSCARS